MGSANSYLQKSVFNSFIYASAVKAITSEADSDEEFVAFHDAQIL